MAILQRVCRPISRWPQGEFEVFDDIKNFLPDYVGVPCRTCKGFVSRRFMDFKRHVPPSNRTLRNQAPAERSRISSTNCPPYRASFAWPTPRIVENSCNVVGLRSVMSHRLASLKMMYGGMPASSA